MRDHAQSAASSTVHPGASSTRSRAIRRAARSSPIRWRQALPPSSPVTSAASSARATDTICGMYSHHERSRCSSPSAGGIVREAATSSTKPLDSSRWRAIAVSSPARLSKWK